MKRIAVAAVSLGLLLGLFPAGMALADQVPTTAQVSGAGTPPVVLYKFEVPDADSATPGIQYASDDAADFVPGAQIAPNLEDQPEMQKIAYWWVATDPNGLADIIDEFVMVWHPDGTLKYQIHQAQNALPTCADLGTWQTPGTPLNAAYRSGQLTSAQADLIVENCNKNVWKPFMTVGDISKEQPAGDYTVTASVGDQAGNTGDLTNTMQILPVIGLVLDFTSVDFGQILPNTPKWVRGDMSMSTPTMPTVKNTGNVNMYLTLNFSTMLGVRYQKIITSFDGKLNSQTIDPISAGTPVCFNNTPLGSNELGQLDLSIHPGAIPGDTYNGTLTVVGGMHC